MNIFECTQNNCDEIAFDGCMCKKCWNLIACNGEEDVGKAFKIPQMSGVVRFSNIGGFCDECKSTHRILSSLQGRHFYSTHVNVLNCWEDRQYPACIYCCIDNAGVFFRDKSNIEVCLNCIWYGNCGNYDEYEKNDQNHEEVLRRKKDMIDFLHFEEYKIK